MSDKQRSYIAIDLKSFYASVECMERNLDPMTTNLVVADESRTTKTICLAVSPSLKSYGIPGRPRLFEVVRRVAEVNAERLTKTGKGRFEGSSWDNTLLKEDSRYALDYIVAPPRMAKYMEVSARIYQVYLKYIAPEDMHVYSIDEVFIDATDYLKNYGMTPRELAMTMILDVYHTTGITAAAGIGTNLYLCKVAMDIVSKHIEPDEHGVRIASLDELSYRRMLWNHRPLTDFWRVGRGYQKKLEERGLYTMGDIARCSLGTPGEYYNEELLYSMFGVNAELLIDHAWGWEPCRMEDIKAYQPQNNSMVSGQVLQCAYDFDMARNVTREMADDIALNLTDKGLVTDQLVLTVGYDVENLNIPERRMKYHGQVVTDGYGRKVPKHAHGTENLDRPTASGIRLQRAAETLYDRIVNPELLVRRISLTANHIENEKQTWKRGEEYRQMDLFGDFLLSGQQEAEKQKEEREKKMQKAILSIKKKYGKNAVLKGMNYEKGATGRERNNQIGGHKA